MEKTSNTEAVENYEAASAKLAHLIDHPETHLPASEYRAHIRVAQKFRSLAYKEMIAARHG